MIVVWGKYQLIYNNLFKKLLLGDATWFFLVNNVFFNINQIIVDCIDPINEVIQVNNVSK